MTLSPQLLSAFKADLELTYADPQKAAVIDQIHKIVHWIATSDPATDRTKIDRLLTMVGLVAWFIPGLSAIIGPIKAIVDAPGGIETVVQLAGMLDAILPPLPA